MQQLRKFSQIIVAAFIVASCHVVNAHPLSVPEGKTTVHESKALCLRQTGVISGQFDVYVTDNFAYAHCQRSDLTVVARAPDWRVSVFSRRSGKLYSCPYAKFKLEGALSNSLGLMGLPRPDLIELVRRGKTKILGCDATEYETAAGYEALQMSYLKQNMISRLYPKYAYMAVFENHIYPRPVWALVAGLHGLSNKYGLPLTMKYQTINGGWHYPLKTMPVKYENIAETLLAVPGGLTQVKSTNEVMLDSTGKEGLDQMLNNIAPDVSRHN